MLCQFLTVGLLGAELLGNGESRHDRTAVDGVEFYFVGYLEVLLKASGISAKMVFISAVVFIHSCLE